MPATPHPLLPDILTQRELRECGSCGARFVGLRWHSRCSDCCRGTHVGPYPNGPSASAELKQTQAELASVRLELARQQQLARDATAKLVELERARAVLQIERDQWKRRYHAVLSRSDTRSAVPPDILRRLLWLCHPDRQGETRTPTSPRPGCSPSGYDNDSGRPESRPFKRRTRFGAMRVWRWRVRS